VELKYTTEKLTKIKLKDIEFDDVIYGERSQSGAMGNAGGVILYVFKQNILMRYETSVFDDEKTAREALKQITLHEELFNLYYGGMGNGVFINKKSPLKIDHKNKCFWYASNGDTYRIDSSVYGVYKSVVESIEDGVPKGLYTLHQAWEQSLRKLFSKKKK